MILRVLGSIYAKSEPSARQMLILGLCYLALSFSYSFIGFLHPEPTTFLPEYTYSSFTLEILGHFAFGVIATLPLLDLDLALLGGACAVLIDSDHVLDSLNLGVSGRPDHSILFVLISMLVMFALVRKVGLSRSTQVKIMFLAPAIVLNHLSFDVFAGGGSTFQLLIPFSFQSIALSYGAWYPLLLAAMMFSALGCLSSKHWGENNRREKIRSKELEIQQT